MSEHHKLKPCPFCGWQKLEHRRPSLRMCNDRVHGCWTVRCNAACDIETIPHGDKKRVVLEWNLRNPQDKSGRMFNFCEGCNAKMETDERQPLCEKCKRKWKEEVMNK